MKSYIYPLLITLLGLLAAYLFYALWHTEVPNPPQTTEKQQEKPAESLSDKVIAAKTTAYPQSSISVQNVKKSQIDKNDEIEKGSELSKLTPQQIKAQTEALYEELMPEEHEETMQEAQTAFEELDMTVQAQDTKLAEEMQEAEESQEIFADNIPEEDLPQEEQTDMTVPENEEETDMENEDINNL